MDTYDTGTKLSRPLGQEYISTRVDPSWNGRITHFITARQARLLADEIFGVGAWASEVKSMTHEDLGDQTVLATCQLRVLSGGSFHEDIGFGIGSGSSAYARASELAEGDALKRALRLFGLANCLYNEKFTRWLRRHFSS